MTPTLLCVHIHLHSSDWQRPLWVLKCLNYFSVCSFICLLSSDLLIFLAILNLKQFKTFYYSTFSFEKSLILNLILINCTKTKEKMHFGVYFQRSNEWKVCQINCNLCCNITLIFIVTTSLIRGMYVCACIPVIERL